MRCICILTIAASFAATLAGCGRKPSNAQPVLVSPTPAAGAMTATPALAKETPAPPAGPNFSKMAERFSRALIGVTVFDSSGKLLTNGTGFFVSEDGKFITDASVVAHGENAIAKASSGKIYNVSGFVSRGDARNLALLKADAHDVPFIALAGASGPAVGGQVAVVSTSTVKAWQAPLHGAIATRSNDAAGEVYEIAPPVPKARTGSVVLDDRGEIVGVITSRGENSDATVVRPLSAVSSLLSRASSTTTASWQSSPTPSPSASPTPTPSSTPKPSATPARKGRIVYNPPPIYPTEARRSHFPIRGAGSYRILFGPDGRASSVQVLHSTGNQLLDSSAVSGLGQWRAEPGPSFSITVPVTFAP